MNTIYLARHGQTDWNRDSRFQGQRDISLNERGKAQAAALRDRLAEVVFQRIYSSDLTRALATAQTIARDQEAEVITDPRLREMSFGSWEGLTYPEIKAHYPRALARWEEDLMSTAPPGGENLAELISRVEEFRSDRLEEVPGDSLIVAHGGSLQVMITLLLDHDPNGYWQFHLDPAGLSILGVYPLGGILKKHNAVGHVPGNDFPVDPEGVR